MNSSSQLWEPKLVNHMGTTGGAWKTKRDLKKRCVNTGLAMGVKCIGVFSDVKSPPTKGERQGKGEDSGRAGVPEPALNHGR